MSSIKPNVKLSIFLVSMVLTAIVIGSLYFTFFKKDNFTLRGISPGLFIKKLFAFDVNYETPPSSKILSPELLLNQEFVINPKMDTTIYTLNGTRIKIPAGALQSEKEGPITICIKEAFTMEDIALAGLVTKSGKELLSSDGMIYIQAKDSANVRLTKPITAFIPTNEINYRMQVYKGIESAEHTIDWQNPTTLQNDELKSQIEGKALFKEHCESCHSIGDGIIVGPDLAHIVKRRDGEWLSAFVQNSQAMVDRDVYAKCLFNHYNKSVMTDFSNQKEKIPQILEYIHVESALQNLPYPDDQLFECYIKCQKYEKLMSNLKNRKNQIKNKSSKLKEENESFVSEINELTQTLENMEATTVASRNLNSSSTSFVRRIQLRPEYYKLEINTLGWYNIDIFLKNVKGVADAILKVKVDRRFRNYFTIFLALPDFKVNVQGGALAKEDDTYGFYEDNGSIKLPLNTTGILYLVGEKDQELIFASSKFSTEKNIQLQLNPTFVDKDELNKKLNSLFSGTTLEVKSQKSLNADSLRLLANELKFIENQIENTKKLQPKDCDCTCVKEAKREPDIQNVDEVLIIKSPQIN